LFVSVNEPIKYFRLSVRNQGTRPRRLAAIFFAELVLGTHRDGSAAHIVTEIDKETGAILVRSAWHADFRDTIVFADVNQRPRTVTADRLEFLGRNGRAAAPAGCMRASLSGAVGACLDPCAALHAPFTLGPGEQKDIVFVFGEAMDIAEARRLVRKAHDPTQIRDDRQEFGAFWDRITGHVTIRTPNRALDLLVNRWLPYQVLSCRLWGRSGFYQSGGAYGFRDQLQDCMAFVYALPDEARRHLLRAAGRQFTLGDVQHWWHEPSGAGVRTRFSDDFLWLPFAVHHYVETTGDLGVLDEQVPFLEAPELREDQEEDYRVPAQSDETASLWDHCLRAIHHGLRLGVHGLPLMGTGDWNDGMNRVGAGGRGESVWLAWFLVAVLERFAALCDRRGLISESEHLREQARSLISSIELHAWDGQWYRRAYFDDGQPLGSAANEECRIDSLPQSWAVLSGGSHADRARTAMASVDEHLVKRADKLVLLFAPPFDEGELQPGYVKGYVPGIRENGGQYTHAAVWVAQAWALLGDADRAMEILNMINPILRTDRPETIEQYQLEPYVIAADIYSQPPHVGRGGWSWYTGSASWYYRVVIETIVGLDLRGDRLRLHPRLPRDWPEAKLTLHFRSSVYVIAVRTNGQQFSTLDGHAWDGVDFPLKDDGHTHSIVVSISTGA
jgi:cyclic beta-1,2-glucan synthetase